MRPPRSVSVVGAGPAGLAAAIELARHGVRVVVYEQRGAVGSRLAGDFEALENWTTEEDALEWLAGLGVTGGFPTQAVHHMTLADPELARRAVLSPRPMVYVVKRGPEPDSFDRALAAQAAALGVEFRFHTRVRAADVAGPVVVATGAGGTQGVAAGIVAETSAPDQVVAIISDAVAPRCYAYCVVWRGRATVATALARDFDQAWSCFERAAAAFARLGLSDFRSPRRFGGRVHVGRLERLVDGERLYVGEAAGLQDYLFGFGLRYAVASGHLAARALLTGEPYAALVRRELRGGVRAGWVNRLIFDRMGDGGYRHFVRWLARAGDVRRRVRRLYGYGPFHRALWPVALLAQRDQSIRRDLEPVRHGRGTAPPIAAAPPM